jgi:hypothetical protein
LGTLYQRHQASIARQQQFLRDNPDMPDDVIQRRQGVIARSQEIAEDAFNEHRARILDPQRVPIGLPGGAEDVPARPLGLAGTPIGEDDPFSTPRSLGVTRVLNPVGARAPEPQPPEPQPPRRPPTPVELQDLSKPVAPPENPEGANHQLGAVGGANLGAVGGAGGLAEDSAHVVPQNAPLAGLAKTNVLNDLGEEGGVSMGRIANGGAVANASSMVTGILSAIPGQRKGAQQAEARVSQATGTLGQVANTASDVLKGGMSGLGAGGVAGNIGSVVSGIASAIPDQSKQAQQVEGKVSQQAANIGQAAKTADKVSDAFKGAEGVEGAIDAGDQWVPGLDLATDVVSGLTMLGSELYNVFHPKPKQQEPPDPSEMETPRGTAIGGNFNPNAPSVGSMGVA